MPAFAAVMTGRGTGAIAAIQICGEQAKTILEKIFNPIGEKPSGFNTGKILVGSITDGNQILDQVTIGCEGPDTFAINCHGNPLLVERIMQLLRQQGIELITAGQMLLKISPDTNTIALEAKLTLPNVKTINGSKLILSQINSGLTATAKKWQTSTLAKISADAKKILKQIQAVRFLVFGCRIVLAGPPNSGKSTLLNRLSGKQKAIVTNIKGTTRDWVSADCQIGSLAAGIIDTAGLNEKLTNDVDKAAQKAAVEIIDSADLLLLVLDNSQSVEQLTDNLMKSTAGKKILTVLNKCDLPALFDTTKLSGNLAHGIVRISALLGTGVDALSKKICEITSIENVDSRQPVCFTSRQQEILTRLTNTHSRDLAHRLITELLSGRLSV